MKPLENRRIDETFKEYSESAIPRLNSESAILRLNSESAIPRLNNKTDLVYEIKQRGENEQKGGKN